MIKFDNRFYVLTKIQQFKKLIMKAIIKSSPLPIRDIYAVA